MPTPYPLALAEFAATPLAIMPEAAEMILGVLRGNKNLAALAEAQEIIRFWHRYVMDKVFDAPEGWECQNMLTVALLVAHSAGLRKESRGVHYRMDHTQTDDEQYQKHIEVVRAG